MKNVFITGGDKGIGKAIAVQLSLLCDHVIITYNQNEKGAKELADQYKNIHIYQCNLMDVNQMALVANDVLEKYNHIDILINNAGYEDDSSFLKMKVEQWSGVIDVDLKSLFYFTQTFAKTMVANEWGRVINLSSILAYTGVYGGANYAAAKAGIVGFTKSLAKELGNKNITINAIAPGVIETDLLMRMPEKYRDKLRDVVPSHKFGKAEDVAYLVEFLVSEKASYINGQTIHVNGGMYAI